MALTGQEPGVQALQGQVKGALLPEAEQVKAREVPRQEQEVQEPAEAARPKVVLEVQDKLTEVVMTEGVAQADQVAQRGLLVPAELMEVRGIYI